MGFLGLNGKMDLHLPFVLSAADALRAATDAHIRVTSYKNKKIIKEQCCGGVHRNFLGSVAV